MTKSFIALSSALVALTLVAACSPLALLNATTPTDDHRAINGVAYGDNPRQKLDLYIPESHRPALPRRGVLLWRVVAGRQAPGLSLRGAALASRGCLALVVDYRVYPEVRYPEFLRDGAAAVRWAHDHVAEYGGDPQRLFVMGHSAGAYNAAMLAFDSRWLGAEGLDPKQVLKGMIGLSGPYDFLPIIAPVVQTIFGPREQWPATQPIAYVSAGAPPALLATGDTDETVLPKNSRNLAHRLRAVGVPVEETEYPGVGHARMVVALAGPFRHGVPVLDEIARFIAAH